MLNYRGRQFAGLFAALLFSLVSSAAHAASLDEIKSKGEIKIGIVVDQPPYSFIDDSGKNDGYDIDISKLMVASLGVKAVYVPVTSANRIAQLMTGKVDMLICVLGIYAERAKVIQYVAPYSAHKAAIYGPKESTLKSLAELSGHSIGVEKGSSMEKAISDAAPKDADIRRYDDASSAVRALLSGQVEYLASYGHQFMGAEKAAPGKFAEKVLIKTEYLGIAVNPQSRELGSWAGDFMSRHWKDGSIASMYQKRFGTSMPAIPSSFEGVIFTMQ